MGAPGQEEAVKRKPPRPVMRWPWCEACEAWAKTAHESVCNFAGNQLDELIARIQASEKRADDAERAAIVGAFVVQRFLTSPPVNALDMADALAEADDLADLAAEARAL